MNASIVAAVRVLLLCVVTQTAMAEGESLSALIDQHMKPVSGLVPVSCSDAEFHRRVSLDLIGMPPTADEWQTWLLKSVRESKPWNVLVREMLVADGDDVAARPAARFGLDRGSEPNLLTHDISRIFFGRDMQCAQCHDHPLVDEYLQSDYHGLLAYVAPSYALVRKDGDKQITLQAERAGSDLAFESVFVKGTQHRT